MLCILSPAKKLAARPPARLPLSRPRLLEDATTLARLLAGFSPSEIASLMSLSDTLAQLNVARFQAWKPQLDEHASAALLTFIGDVYIGFDATSMQDAQLQQAQQQLRILSGLYGVLRPFDGIHPYRLEMGSKLANPRGANLYDYWRNKVTGLLRQDMRNTGTDLLVNLASNEYARAVDFAALEGKVVTPQFYDQKNGKTRMLQLYVKRARGMMARYLIENRVDTLDALRAFDAQGYTYTPSRSTAETPVFIRTHG